jgi:hypothetical protein
LANDEALTAPAPSGLPVDAYIRSARLEYTREAIDDRLRAAGYADDDVAEAWRRVLAEDQAAGLADRRGLASRIVMLSYVGFWLFYAVASAVTPGRGYLDFRGLAVIVLGFVLLVPMLVGIATVRRSRRLRLATSGAVLSAIAAPIVLLVGIGGVCLAAYPPFGVN